MSLHAFQETLLEIYNNKPSLDRFMDDPDGALADRDLTERERAALRSVASKHLVHFQRGLRAKRASVAEKVLDVGPNLVMLASSNDAGLAIFFSDGGNMREERVSNGTFRLFQALHVARVPLSAVHLRASYRRGTTRARDLFEAVRLVARYRLEGREIFIP